MAGAIPAMIVCEAAPDLAAWRRVRYQRGPRGERKTRAVPESPEPLPETLWFVLERSV